MSVVPPPHLLRGSVGSEAEARSIIRWSAGLYLGLAVVMFVCVQAAAYYANALDLPAGEVTSEAITWLVILTPPIGLLLSRARAAAATMIVIAALLTIFLSGLGLEMWPVAASFTNPREPLNSISRLVWGTLAFAGLWLATTWLAWRAFRASLALKRFSHNAAHTAAGIFD